MQVEIFVHKIYLLIEQFGMIWNDLEYIWNDGFSNILLIKNVSNM